MSLSPEDREMFAAAMHDCFQGWKGDPRGTVCGDCLDDADALSEVVEAIVVRHVSAALNAAADELDHRASGGTALNYAARIVRAAIPPP